MKISFIVLFFIVVCRGSELEISDNDYELIDGIMVPKKTRITEERRTQDGKDKDDEEVYYKDDDVTEDDAPEEENEMTTHLPTKCHVCRLLVVELEERLSKLGRIRQERPNRAPIYYKEEKVILNAIQDLCEKMKSYNIRRSQPFRYKKGVKSYSRLQVEDAMKDSKVKHFLFFTPEQDIDDPTGEIQRLQNQCHDLLVDHQHDLIHWFHKAQSRDLTTWFCRNRVLVNENQDCLNQEIPTKRKKKQVAQKENNDKENSSEVEKTNNETIEHQEL
ncbi:protein canopy 4-like [Actinia tenebrosa]|uniref:Protein canopy 4-like n=1 Tax=Actinia tenebrosa TaxID=6105 RepID=A0A6P8INX4_ACTTE|nr:protein canopy 4-like [Actinia tenebrosa]